MTCWERPPQGKPLATHGDLRMPSGRKRHNVTCLAYKTELVSAGVHTHCSTRVLYSTQHKGLQECTVEEKRRTISRLGRLMGSTLSMSTGLILSPFLCSLLLSPLQTICNA